MQRTLEMRIAWSDCGADGLMHPARCFQWMDAAFQTLMLELDLGHRALVERYGVHIPIVEAGAEFDAPATYDEMLSVEVHVSRWGRRSFRIDYAARRGADDIFHGFETRVWASIADDGSIATAPIAIEFRAAVEAGGL